MQLEERPIIEALGRHHDRAAFSCGTQELDRYIQQQASQDVRRKLARVFVAVKEQPGSIMGFYTLSAASVELESLPEDLASKLPKYPIPVARIGRLAVDSRHQGKGLGSYLLMDALSRVLSASAVVAMLAVVVDAKNASAKTFYEKYGFRAFRDAPLTLFVPLATIEKL